MSLRAVSIVCAWSLLTVPAAAANPMGPSPSDTREDLLRAEIEPITRADLGLRWRADLIAAALATTGDDVRGSGGLGAASAEVALTSGSTCDVAAAGGQVTGRSDDRTLSFQQWASVCPLGGNGHVAFDHRLEWDVAPRLLAAPRLRPGQQRRETVGFDFFGSTVRTNDQGPLVLVPSPPEWEQGGQARMEVQIGWSEAHDTDEVRAMMDVVLRTWRRDYDDEPALALTVVTARLEVLTRPGPVDLGSAASLSAEAGRVEGLRLGHGLRFGARLGGRFVGLSKDRGTHHALTTYIIGEGSLSLERDLSRRLTVRLAGDRQGWPAWDGRFIVDDRATLSVFGSHRRVRGRIDLSAARTHLLEVHDQHAVSTGGLAAEASLPLGRHLTLRARSEAGRSVYAAGASLDAPIWASESLLLLAMGAASR